MNLEKNKPYRNKKILNAAKDCPYCMNCGRPSDGTIVAAHYTGFRQHSLGKGLGQKCTDTATAFLCHACHKEMDGASTDSLHYKSEKFLFAIVETHDYLFQSGIIK